MSGCSDGATHLVLGLVMIIVSDPTSRLRLLLPLLSLSLSSRGEQRSHLPCDEPLIVARPGRCCSRLS